MKVLHTVYNLDKFSGAAFQAFDLAKWTIKADKHISCTMLNRTSNCTSFTEAADLKVIHSSGGYFSHLLKCISAVLDCDIVHIHGYNFTALAVSVLLKKKIIFKSTLLNFDDFDSLSRRKWIGCLNKYLISKIDFNNSLSVVIYNINKRYLSEEKISVIPNSVPVSDFNYYVKNDNVFVVVGAVVPRKNTDKAIEYFIENYLELPNSKLIVIGPYDEDIKESDSKFTAKCLSYRDLYPNKIEFTGKISKEKVLENFRKAKAMIFFPEYEGFGSVVIESQISNCVPIVTPFGGVELDTIIQGENGYILELPKQKVSIENIDSLLSTQSMSYSSYNKYNPQAVFSKYLKIYRRLFCGKEC